MNFKEKIWKALGITEKEYNKELAKQEYERRKTMAANGGYIAAAQARQLGVQQAQLKSQYNQALAQQQAAMNNAWNQASVLGQYANPTATPSTLAVTNLSGERLYTFEELNDEGSVYNMPLQTAVDLAINKFGSGWFKDETTAEALEENQDFWVQVMSKLWQQKRLERQQVRHFDRDEITTAWKILDTDHGNN